MKLIRKICLFLLILPSTLFGYFDNYNSILLPYQFSVIPGQRLGGTTNSAFEFIPVINQNAASLANLEETIIFSSYKQEIEYYQINFEKPWDKNSIKNTDYNYSLSYTAFAIPFHVFRRNTVLAFSFNGFNQPAFNRKFYKDIQGLELTQQTAHSWSSGISSQLTSNFNIGLNWTKWFGHFKWNEEEYSGFPPGKYNINGHMLQIALLKKFKQTDIGITVFSPFQLMKSDNLFSNSPGIAYVKQKFDGAIKLGISKKVNPKWLFALSYTYQRPSKILYETRLASEYSKIITTYKAASLFSTGLEYFVKIGKYSLPVFINYQYNILPENEVKLTKNVMALGASLITKHLGYHIITQFGLYNRYNFMAEENLPIYS